MVLKNGHPAAGVLFSLCLHVCAVSVMYTCTYWVWVSFFSSSMINSCTYMHYAVMVGSDKPAIPGQRCFEFVSSH